MKPLDSITGQNQARRVLLAAVESRRLAHAYIFAGPEGSGRLTSALDLARVLMCSEEENGFCGHCTQCRQISAFSHPDVRLTIPVLKSTSPDDIIEKLNARAEDGITPIRFSGNTYISIEQVRALEGRLSKKSYTGKGYVEIILDAHLMGREAANAMLKTLEEPPAGTLLVLVTSRLRNLLPTVRSRAHTVRFGRLPSCSVKEVLLSRGVEMEKAEQLSMVADGCPGRALELSREEIRGSEESMELFSHLVSGESGTMELSALAAEKAREHGREGLLKLCSDMISLAHDVRRARAGLLPLINSSLPSAETCDDMMLTCLIERMDKCMVRLKANVSPVMAFSAALAGAAPGNRR
ncbi:hypothetical protein CSA37_12300 [Candidatus Fermentibacteria bacterium]|nr:MAG: hypothetical protein CSA37_12300 [Candidatus Fermentibacteria bacterium]